MTPDPIEAWNRELAGAARTGELLDLLVAGDDLAAALEAEREAHQHTKDELQASDANNDELLDIVDDRHKKLEAEREAHQLTKERLDEVEVGHKTTIDIAHGLKNALERERVAHAATQRRLEKYGEHLSGCSTIRSGRDCDCGWATSNG